MWSIFDEIVYFRNNLRQRKSDKPTLILIHGALGGTGYYYKNIPHIDRNILSIDLPGFGESDRVELKNPESDWTTALRDRFRNIVFDRFLEI